MIIPTTITRLASGGWGFTWPAGTAPYTIRLDGRSLGAVDVEAYDFVLPGYDDAPPALEITSDGDVAEGQLYPPRVRLQWRGFPTALGYVVEQYVGSDWVRCVSVGESKRGYYLWDSPALDDASTARFRVVAVDKAANRGVELECSQVVMRNPATPEVTVAIVAGAIVVSAA